jgi:gas vesicle protein
METYSDENERANGSSGNFLVAFLSGAALGALAGVLLAPGSGSENRKKLRGYIEKGKDSLRQLGEKAEEAFEETTSIAKEAANEGRRAMKAGKNRLRETAEEAASEQDM